MRPQLENCVQLLAHKYEKDMDLFERVQRKTTKMIRVLEHISCGQRLRELEFVLPEKEILLHLFCH